MFEWNAQKAETNFRKHGVRFADAVAVLQDQLAITVRDADPREERWVTMGIDALGRLLVVVHTWRLDSIRIISARTATPSERKQYVENL